MISKFFPIFIFFLNSCTLISEESYIPLSDLYADYFLIGNILSGGMENGSKFRQDKKELGILLSEFNCLTAENSMKMAYMQPEEGKYNFVASDALVDLAHAADMEIVGHALVWHHQVPDWIFKDSKGNAVNREELIKRMKDHIFTIMNRYKGRIKYWDVVNEAVDLKINQKGEQEAFLRKSPWYEIIGEEYIELAYKFAHEADPDAMLLYNDYSMTDLVKTRFVADMIKDLKAKGLPIHGVGIQGHWHLEWPSNEDLEEALGILSDVGVMISITELDIGVIPRPMGADISLKFDSEKELNPYRKEIPSFVLEQQAKKYESLFKIFLENSDVIERVSFWGVVDHYSWLRNWPIEGRTVYPAIFDRNYNPKPAYFMLRKLVE